MKHFYIVLASLSLFNVSFAQDSTAIQFAETITADELRNHLMIIASDDFEGRDTGSEGQKKAAAYIADRFVEYGFPPVVEGTYFQKFPLKQESLMGSSLKVNEKELSFITDFFFFPGMEAGNYNLENLIFAGYGIETDAYNDYEGIDVKGKAVVVFSGEPKTKKGDFLLTGSDKASGWAENYAQKRELAERLGATSLIVIHENYKFYLSRIKYYLESPRLSLDKESSSDSKALPMFFISAETAELMFLKSKLKSPAFAQKKIQKKKKPFSGELMSSATFSVGIKKEIVESENVLGYLEGTDKKDEVVVITAHFDHVGMKGEDIYNGADDDGSGTVTVLELAQAFSEAAKAGHRPRRSILFMTVSGEEKGLLGSEWYGDHPVYPLDKTVADLNIDMIGRVDEKHKEDPAYIYLIGSDRLSTELHEISENANSSYTDLELDYTYNDPQDPNRFYYRSDHYNFAKFGIPVIFYFSGVHEDYHQPTDTPDKIMYEKMVPIAQLIFYTTWELANRENKIIVDVEPEGIIE